MALAKTYTAVTKMMPLPVIAEVVMFFNISALGLALAWLATVWATSRLAGTTDLGRRAGGGLADADLPDLHQLRRAGNGFRDGRRCWPGPGEDRCWPESLIGLGVAAKLYPVLLLVPLVVLGDAHRAAARGGAGRRWRRSATWLVVNLPVMVLFPRGWSEFFRLNTRRGDDMDSLYNVVKSFTGWDGFDAGSRVLGAAGGPEHRRRRAVPVVLCRNRLHRADGAAAAAGGAAGVPGRGRVPVDEQGVEPAVLAVAGAAGGAGVAAPPNPVGVDDHRRAGVGAADALPVRRAEQGPARAVVHRARCCCATSR